MRERLEKFFDAVRSYKKSLSIITDIILILLSLYLAYLIRLGSIDNIDERYLYQISLIALIIVPFKIIIFWIFRLYHITFRYISLGEVLSIIKASAFSSPMIAFIALVFRDMKILIGFPRSVIFIDFFLTFFFITSVRAFFRIYYTTSNKRRGREILIVGSGSAGEQMVRDMMRSPQSSYFPVGFIDDDPPKKNTLIHGVRVLGSREDIPKLVKDHNIKEIMIAIPSATSKEIRGIMGYVRKTNIKNIKVLPSLSDLINGKVTLRDIRDISIEDLLGREPVEIDMGEVSSYIRDKNILVTGAGGSIGSELCKQISRFNPAKLIMLDIGETGLFNIDMEEEI